MKWVRMALYELLNDIKRVSIVIIIIVLYFTYLQITRPDFSTEATTPEVHVVQIPKQMFKFYVIGDNMNDNLSGHLYRVLSSEFNVSFKNINENIYCFLNLVNITGTPYIPITILEYGNRPILIIVGDFTKTSNDYYKYLPYDTIYYYLLYSEQYHTDDLLILVYNGEKVITGKKYYELINIIIKGCNN